MNKRKYPFSMFCMGTILNLIKLWPYYIVAIIFSIIHLFNPIVPIEIPILLIGISIIIAMLQEFRQIKILLSHFEDEETNDLLDKMFSDNSKGYKNVIEAVDEIIKDNNIESK